MKANSHFAHNDQLFLSPLYFVTPNHHPVLNNFSKRTNSGGIVNCPLHFASHPNWTTLVTHRQLFPCKHAQAAIQMDYYPFFLHAFFIPCSSFHSLSLLPNNRAILWVLLAQYRSHQSERQLFQKLYEGKHSFYGVDWSRPSLHVGINSKELKPPCATVSSIH